MSTEIIELKNQLKALSEKLDKLNKEEVEEVEEVKQEDIKEKVVEPVKCPLKMGVCPMSEAVKQFKVCPMKVCPMADFIRAKKPEIVKDLDYDVSEFYPNDEFCSNCSSNYENSLVLLFICIILVIVLLFLSKKLLESVCFPSSILLQ